MSTFTPPVPAQRKVKLVTSLKTTLSEQTAKLQSKHELEHDLLEDVRNYAKQRAGIEKEYAQSILKITSQMVSKIVPCKIQASDDTEKEQLRSPYGLWRKILEETETMANSRMKISQTLLSDVVDSIKNFKVERLSTLKKCTTLTENLQEEIVVSTGDLVKAQKTYSELQKLTIQAHQHASDAQEKLQSGNVSIFSSRAKLEKNASKSNERKDASEKRSTTARNEYLLTLAAINAHQRKYYSQDLPDLIATQDGKIYENLKEYYTTITNVERDACKECVKNLDNLEGHIKMLDRAYAIMCFLKENAIFTKCEPYEYCGVTGDEVLKISNEYGAGLTLNKEARKWTLRLAREQKAIRKKTKRLKGLKAMTLVDMNISSSNENCATADSVKTTEQSIETLAEEIRHLEVLRTKAEGRVDALKEAGENVDEWLQGAISEQEEEEENDTTDNNQFVEDDEFVEEDWGDSFPSYNFDNYSDDGISVSSSIDQKSYANHAIALYAFEANSQEELSIVVGEELELLETEGDGWCRTRNKLGDVGFVPETYIEVKRNKAVSEDGESISKASSQASSSISEVHIDNSSVSVNISDVDTTPTPIAKLSLDTLPGFVCFAKAIYDYDAIEDEELTFQEGDIIMITSKMVDDDDGWWEGVLNGSRGVFPSLLVEETKPPDPSLGSQDDHTLRQQNLFIDPNDDIPRSRTLDYNDIKGFSSLVTRGGHT